MKILLVDDNDEFRSILIDFLTDNGHSVEPFSEPSLALHCLEFMGNQIDCIITDYNMLGIDGAEFATEAKKLRVPIFMCTAACTHGNVIHICLHHLIELQRFFGLDFFKKP